jgi:hypothetical protein
VFMASKFTKFAFWAFLIVCLLLAGCCACYLWQYVFEYADEPYRLVDELFEEPYDVPEPPPNPIVYENQRAYFEADGIRFEMPYSFVAEYPDTYGPQPGPHFDYYFRSYERNAIIRVRRTESAAGSAEADELELYARLYVEMGAGELVEEAKIERIPGDDMKTIGADYGVEVLYELAPENRSTWDYSLEYAIFLAKKPDDVWTVSLAIIALDELDAELMRKKIRETVRLAGE